MASDIEPISLDAADIELWQTGSRERETGSVLVLLSTFNGEAYLPEFLQSLMSQTHGHWRLYWRDDGSTDSSETIVLQFAARLGPGRFTRVTEPRSRVGPSMSYLSLLDAALPTLTSKDAIAFADQDDVWRPEKLRFGMIALGAADHETPTLYCARLALTDARLNRICETQISRAASGFPGSLAENIAVVHCDAQFARGSPGGSQQAPSYITPRLVVVSSGDSSRWDRHCR